MRTQRYASKNSTVISDCSHLWHHCLVLGGHCEGQLRELDADQDQLQQFLQEEQEGCLGQQEV